MGEKEERMELLATGKKIFLSLPLVGMIGELSILKERRSRSLFILNQSAPHCEFKASHTQSTLELPGKSEMNSEIRKKGHSWI